jgi:hypothetical protein
MGSRFLTLCAIVLVALSAGSASGATARAKPGCTAAASTLAVLDCARLPAVASLDPEYAAGKPRFRLAQAGSVACRPTNLVFYAARDWLRLGPKLAERASPCANYYISVPPLVSDKTKPRPNQAWRIRALGPRFHAMAEIHWTTWQRWVRDTGGTWYDAGVEARRRMAAAGYDVALGDTWAVNEFPSSVRRDLGTAREDARLFVRGLYDGDGHRVRGAVFVIGVMHGTTDASLYKSTLKGWLADTAFWREMRQTVRFWGQEVYADARRWGVSGASTLYRRDNLNDFLQHAVRLSSVAPARYGAARTFLSTAYTPIANAGWQWPRGLGWTMISADQMEGFVSAQTYALRKYAAQRPDPEQFGFAWAPNNATGLAATDFTTATGGLLDRLGAALAESGGYAITDEGSAACLSDGMDFCTGDVAGAAFTDAWRIFSVWSQVGEMTFRRLVPWVRPLVVRSRRR